MAELRTWGIGFLKALEWHPSDESLLAGLAVASVAREALVIGRVSWATRRRALTLLCPIESLAVRKWARSVIAACCTSAPGWPHCIVNPLKIYGRDLNTEGHYGAALDVLSLIADSDMVDRDDRLSAMQWCGHAARRANDLPTAILWYGSLGVSAREWGSEYYMLRSSLGLACIEIAQGRYAQADDMLTDVYASAEGINNTDLMADTLVAMGAVAGGRGQFTRAACHGLEAARLTSNPVTKHLAIQNAAEAYARMGTAEALVRAAEFATWLSTNVPSQYAQRELDDLRHQIAESPVFEPASATDLAGLAPLGIALSDALAQ